MKPYPYQLVGKQFLLDHPHAYLGDGMGLGKCVQSILASREADARSILVVCPASVIPHWHAEFRRWWQGPMRDIRIISYATASRRKLGVVDLLIADEAHYLKTPGATRTKRVLGAARRAERAWLLSGTPAPNYDPMELWAPISALWPEETQGCTTKDDWMDMFCETIPTIYGPKVIGMKNEETMRGILSRVMLQRTLADVGLELPPLRVDLTRIPKPAIFDRLVEEYKAETMTEELYTSTVRRLLGTAKAQAVADIIIRELADGAYKNVVVLYYHKAVGAILRAAFSGARLRVVGFDGSAPTAQRRSAIEAFQADEADVFLSQQVAAGIGIDLTRAPEIVLVEPAWTPTVNEQAIKRIHRIGQDQPCRARIFAASDTLDESVMGTIARKLRLQVGLGLN